MKQKPIQHLSFRYGDEIIDFERVDKAINKATNNGKILIKVHPNCRVVVSAPSHVIDDDVMKATAKRSRWIYQQLRQFREQQAHITPRQYISGESHYYLGKQYQLKVLIQPNEKQGIKLRRGKIEISARQKDSQLVKKLLEEWYKARAKIVFAKRLDVVLEQTLWVKERPPFRILTMKTQWGSCSPKGLLTLNPYLVKAPTLCIDYVILHELCHIAEHNHSERFYQLLTQVMPEWEKIKTRLDSMVVKYID